MGAGASANGMPVVTETKNNLHKLIISIEHLQFLQRNQNAEACYNVQGLDKILIVDILGELAGDMNDLLAELEEFNLSFDEIWKKKYDDKNHKDYKLLHIYSVFLTLTEINGKISKNASQMIADQSNDSITEKRYFSFFTKILNEERIKKKHKNSILEL